MRNTFDAQNACDGGPSTSGAVDAALRYGVCMDQAIPKSTSAPAYAVSRAILGGLAFSALVVFVPAAWVFGGVPLVFTRPALMLYGLGAAAFSAAIIATGDRSDSPRSTYWAVFAGLSVVVLVILGGLWTAEDVFTRLALGAVTETSTPAPSGRLVAVVRDVNQGAFGEDFDVRVRARLIPGVVSWDYELAIRDYVDDVTWEGPGTLIVQGTRYSIPPIIVELGW